MKKETVRVYADINRRVDRWQSNNLYFGIVIGVLASNAVKMIFDGGGLYSNRVLQGLVGITIPIIEEMLFFFYSQKIPTRDLYFS